MSRSTRPVEAKIKPDAGTGIAPVLPALPQHLAEVPVEQHGTETLSLYVIPPRLKIVQPSARAPFSTQFSQGDLVVVPAMQLVSEFHDNPTRAFACVPIFMWAEWCCWNPLGAKGTLPVIRARTLDRQSEIAIKARDPDKREAELCPEFPKDAEGRPQKLKYVEHLNWMLFPLEGPCEGTPICISFFRGSWMSGSAFSGLIQARKAPMYGCVFELSIREKENNKGRFFVPQMDNPDATKQSPWVDDPALFASFQKANQKFASDHAKKLLQVDFDDLDEDTVEGTAQVAPAQQF